MVVPNRIPYISKIDQGGEVTNVLDCEIVETDFELQSRYYVHLSPQLFSLHRNQAKVSLSTVYKAKKKNLLKKRLLRKRRSSGLNKKKKNALPTVIKKDPTKSIRKRA